MSFESNKHVLSLLLLAIGLIALPHINHVPVPVFVFFYALLSWRALGIWKPLWLPGFVVTFALTILGFGLLYQQHLGILGRDAGTNLFMTALALKLMEIKRDRDIYLTTYLAFIVAASQFLYEQSLLILAYVLLVILLLLSVLAILSNRSENILQSLKMTAAISAQAIPIAAVIFLLFPRVESPRWQWFGDKNKSLSSLSDFLEPGSISDLSLSDELVFRVKFANEVPPPRIRYWRGPVMSHTDGKRWTPLNHHGWKRGTTEPTVSGKPYKYTLLMEPQAKNWVFALDMPLSYSSKLSRNENFQLISSQNPEKQAEYRIKSYPTYNTGPITQTEFQEATQLASKPSSRIKQLVKHLHGIEATPETYINRILRYFKTENFRYTLRPPLMEEDPIDTFLFETRSGFCSHYASAFVYLLRAANIPARIVTGFQGGTMNEVGRFLEIRQKDAHAWAEVWLQNKGWVRFDPTAAIAPERLERNMDIDGLELGGEISFEANGYDAGLAAAWLRRTRLFLSSADYNWQRWVINYNSMNQSRFLSLFGIEDAKAMVFWMAAIVALMISLGSLFLLVHARKPTDKALSVYKKYCRKLARQGLARKPGEGAKDFADRAKNKLTAYGDQIDRITELYIALRYGKNPGREDLRQLRALVSKFRI